MLPGSNESGVLDKARVSVPPLVVEGLTTLVVPALYVADPLGDDPLELLLPLLLQALAARAAAAPSATAAKYAASLHATKRLLLLVGSRPHKAGYLVLGSSASRSPSPNRLNAITVRKIDSPGTSMYSGSM